MVEKFDCIVVGAGMSGNAAAYTLASKGLSRFSNSSAANIPAPRMSRAPSCTPTCWRRSFPTFVKMPRWSVI